MEVKSKTAEREDVRKSVIMSKGMSDTVERIAEDEDSNFSAVVRKAVRKYIAEETRGEE